MSSKGCGVGQFLTRQHERSAEFGICLDRWDHPGGIHGGRKGMIGTSALSTMAARDIIVIGGSAGGLEAMRELLPSLPADLPITVFVALHRSQLNPGYCGIDPLPDLLNRTTKLTAVAARDRQRTEVGKIYVAPAGSHLLLEPGCVLVKESAAQELFRPSVDALFRSAAIAYGSRVVGILLSGLLNDGTMGFWEIRRHGGITIVQDPAEAEYRSMPESAMTDVPVHYCLPLSGIAPRLIQLATNQSAVGAPYRPRILIVEDERIIAMNLENRLTALGYEVVASVSSGEAALSSIVPVSPDIVLMDIHLAGRMTGTEAGKILWEQFALPIVYLTAYADEETLNSAKPSMPYAYIVKPYHPPQIHSAIQLTLARREREMPGVAQL